jgi:hypothetical protein
MKETVYIQILGVILPQIAFETLGCFDTNLTLLIGSLNSFSSLSIDNLDLFKNTNVRAQRDAVSYVLHRTMRARSHLCEHVWQSNRHDMVIW